MLITCFLYRNFPTENLKDGNRKYNPKLGSIYLLSIKLPNGETKVFRSTYCNEKYYIDSVKNFDAVEFKIFTIEVDNDAVINEKFLQHNKETGYFDILKNAV
jgi:hypothetical protein